MTSLTSTRFATFAARLGGGSPRALARFAARCGTKLTHQDDTDAIAFKHALQISSQSAVPVTSVSSADAVPHDHSFGADTLGGKFPRSYRGNHYALVFVNHALGQRIPTVAVFATHHASNTVLGLSKWLQESQFDLQLDGSLQPHIHAYLDNGTELQGEFAALLLKHGVQIHRSTAYKHNTARTGIVENCNRELQKKMRVNLAAAAANFASFGLNKIQFWDSALIYAARQLKAQSILDAVDPTDASATAVARQVVHRLLPFPFGALTSMTLQLGSPARSAVNKQLADRATPCLFLGAHSDGRSTVILATGKMHDTIDLREMATPPGVPFLPLSKADMQLLGGAILESTTDADKAATDASVQAVDIPSMDSRVNAHVGDSVDIYWPAMKQSYSGTITEYDGHGDFKHQKIGVAIPSYQVHYNDGTLLWHKVSDASTQLRVTEMAATALADNLYGNYVAYDPVTDFNTGLCSATETILAARPFIPHASVAKYIDERGQIHASLLLGDEDLPPMPPLPPYRRSTTQPPPTTTRQALEGPDAIFWLAGMLTEHVGHVQTPTFKFVDLTESTDARDGLNAKWVFAFKWDGDNLDKFRSRLVLAGFDRIKGIHYKDTYLSAPPVDTMRALECIAIFKQWSTFATDLTRAYTHSTAQLQPNGHHVTARMPNISRVFTHDGAENAIEAVQSMQDFPAAGYEYGMWMCDQLTGAANPIPLRQNGVQPCIYSAKWPAGHKYAGEYYIVYVHSDNILHYASLDAVHYEFMAWYTTAMAVTGGEQPLNKLPPTTRLGMTVAYTKNSVSMTMPAYAMKLLTAHGMQDCNSASTPLPPGFHLLKRDQPSTDEERAEVVAFMNLAFGLHDHNYSDTVRSFASSMQGMNWLGTMCSPGLRTAISLTASASHNPSIKAIRGVKHMLRYVRGKTNDGLTYTRTRVYDKHEFPRPEYSSDASFGDHLDSGKSQGGVVGRFDGSAATYITSRRSGHVCTSTTHAEIYFGSEASRHAVYEHQMFLELGFIMPSPARLQMDNRAAITDAGSSFDVRRFSQRQKHYLMSERYLHQTVAAGILFLEHRDGTLLDADAMSKALPATTLVPHVHTLEKGYHVPANIEG
jgi:hypothetical protein